MSIINNMALRLLSNGVKLLLGSADWSKVLTVFCWWTIIWFCGTLLADFGLLLAHCFGWASPSWGWYPLIALIGIVPIFGVFFYALLTIMKEAP